MRISPRKSVVMDFIFISYNHKHCMLLIPYIGSKKGFVDFSCVSFANQFLSPKSYSVSLDLPCNSRFVFYVSGLVQCVQDDHLT